MQAGVGRPDFAAIVAVAICCKSGLLTARIPPHLATQIKPPFALRDLLKPTSASVGKPSNSMLFNLMLRTHRVCGARMRTGRTQDLCGSRQGLQDWEGDQEEAVTSKGSGSINRGNKGGQNENSGRVIDDTDHGVHGRKQ
jgi:hypothetical protein